MSVSWPYAASIDQFFATDERAAGDASISQDGCANPAWNTKKKVHKKGTYSQMTHFKVVKM